MGLSPAAADVNADQTAITRLRQQILETSAQIQVLARRVSDAQARLAKINAQINADRTNLAADNQQAAAARGTLRRFAAQAYVNGFSLPAPVFVLGTANSATNLGALNQYAGAAGNAMNDALDQLAHATDRIHRDAANLQGAQAETVATMRQLTSARKAAQTAIADDESALQRVSTDLRLQLVAASERAAAQAAAERAFARREHASRSAPHFVIAQPQPGTYQNPMRDVQDLVPERIDQGVDYAGLGPVYALGDGVVLATTVPGWPNNTNIVYELTDGPATGFVVYVAEDIVPAVNVGQTVHADTALGLMYPGPDGIETGWGDPTTIGNTFASAYGQFDGENTTAFGQNFSDLLQSLHAPPGIAQNVPPTGTLPRGWPHW
jgi:predicted  nucleic acid-binding Zn-ribbon protein